MMPNAASKCALPNLVAQRRTSNDTSDLLLVSTTQSCTPGIAMGVFCSFRVMPDSSQYKDARHRRTGTLLVNILLVEEPHTHLEHISLHIFCIAFKPPFRSIEFDVSTEYSLVTMQYPPIKRQPRTTGIPDSIDLRAFWRDQPSDVQTHSRPYTHCFF